MSTDTNTRSSISFMMAPPALERAIIKKKGMNWLVRQYQEYDSIYGNIPITDADYETDYAFMRIVRQGMGVEIELDIATGSDEYRLKGFENDDEAILFMMTYAGCYNSSFN